MEIQASCHKMLKDLFLTFCVKLTGFLSASYDFFVQLVNML